jgi:hypothetical protein
MILAIVEARGRCPGTTVVVVVVGSEGLVASGSSSSFKEVRE